MSPDVPKHDTLQSKARAWSETQQVPSAYRSGRNIDARNVRRAVLLCSACREHIEIPVIRRTYSSCSGCSGKFGQSLTRSISGASPELTGTSEAAAVVPTD